MPELAAPCLDTERSGAGRMRAAAPAHGGDERHGESDRHQLFIISMTLLLALFLKCFSLETELC